MPLTGTDIKVFKSAQISETPSNGGTLSATELVDVVGALFPNVDNTERTNGSTKWRKMFFKIHADNALPFIGSRLYQDADTAGTDTILFAAATAFDDTQNDLPATPDLYGSLPLATSIIVGATTLMVNVPATLGGNFYKTGQTLRVTNKATSDSAGNEEFVTVSNVAQSGSQVTLTFSPAMAAAYSSTNTRVMNVLNIGDVVAKVTNPVVNSASGRFDPALMTLSNRSTISSTWTLTFTSSVNFSIVSSAVDAIGTGNLSNTLAPTNPTYSLPYFTLPATAFSGNYATGDTVIFTTVPAAVGVWLKRIVPAGATPIAVNKATFVWDGGTI